MFHFIYPLFFKVVLLVEEDLWDWLATHVNELVQGFASRSDLSVSQVTHTTCELSRIAGEQLGKLEPSAPGEGGDIN